MKRDRLPMYCGWIAASLLVVMAVLMIGAAREDSATVDETTTLASGYTYWKGHRYYFMPEHPPLGQMLPALPLLFMDVTVSDEAGALLSGRVSYPWTRPWEGPVLSLQGFIPPGCQGRIINRPEPPFAQLVDWQCAASYPLENWYLWALPEGQLFGQEFFYGSGNDGDAMLFRGRCVQILFALGVGVLVFWWVFSATSNTVAATIALGAWVFNPNALAYGHLASTGDIGVTLGMTVAVLLFARFLERPGVKAAVFFGVATGVALLMKLAAVLLAPIFIVLVAVQWKQLKSESRNLWKYIAMAVASAWAFILIIYLGRWAPAPPLAEAQATALGVPGWFRSFRPFLIPPDFFKALAMTLGHAKGGHENYLLGGWSQQGWWYYYPLTFFLKSPVSFVLLTGAAVIVFVKRFGPSGPMERAPWIAAAVYIAVAMTSKVNIGARHILPVFPLLCVGIGHAVARVASRRLIIAATALVAWEAGVAVFAFPCYIQFFSEAVGGADNGYQYLIDSNFDWGQDAKRLKKFLEERHIDHIYLDYFGTQSSIEYYHISNTRISAEQAHEIHGAYLVVSASELMHPEWTWVREAQQPTARVAHTLFVYWLP